MERRKKKNQVDYVLYYSGCIIFNFIVCGRIKRNKTMPYFFFFFALSVTRARGLSVSSLRINRERRETHTQTL